MTELVIVNNAAEVDSLPVGQWAVTADGLNVCLVDTHLGWPQRMWMHPGGRAHSAIDRVTYPLRLADIIEAEPCPHSWGTQECGHCRRCGQVVAEPRELVFVRPARTSGEGQ